MSGETRLWTILGILIAAISAIIAYFQLINSKNTSEPSQQTNAVVGHSSDERDWETRGIPITIDSVHPRYRGVTLHIKNLNSFPVQAIHQIKCRSDGNQIITTRLKPTNGTTDWIRGKDSIDADMEFILDNGPINGYDRFINCYIYSEVRTPDGTNGIRTPLENCVGRICGVGEDGLTGDTENSY